MALLMRPHLLGKFARLRRVTAAVRPLRAHFATTQRRAAFRLVHPVNSGLGDAGHDSEEQEHTGREVGIGEEEEGTHVNWLIALKNGKTVSEYRRVGDKVHACLKNLLDHHVRYYVRDLSGPSDRDFYCDPFGEIIVIDSEKGKDARCAYIDVQLPNEPHIIADVKKTLQSHCPGEVADIALQYPVKDLAAPSAGPPNSEAQIRHP